MTVVGLQYAMFCVKLMQCICSMLLSVLVVHYAMCKVNLAQLLVQHHSFIISLLYTCTHAVPCSTSCGKSYFFLCKYNEMWALHGSRHVKQFTRHKTQLWQHPTQSTRTIIDTTSNNIVFLVTAQQLTICCTFSYLVLCRYSTKQG